MLATEIGSELFEEHPSTVALGDEGLVETMDSSERPELWKPDGAGCIRARNRRERAREI